MLSPLPPAARAVNIFRDIRSYNIDVTALGETAREANVKKLVLTDVVPLPVDATLESDRFSRRIAAVFPGAIEVGQDGWSFVNPVD